MISVAASHLPAARPANRRYALARRIQSVQTLLARFCREHRPDAGGDRRSGGEAGGLLAASMYHNASLL